MATVGPGDVSVLVQLEFDDHLVRSARNVVDVHRPLFRVLVDGQFDLRLGSRRQRPDGSVQPFFFKSKFQYYSSRD